MATPGTTNDTIVSAVAANEPDTAAVLPSPAPLDQETEKNEGQNGSQDDDGSNVKNIMTASPSKPVTRIEDSVEAIDAFEEAIEKVGELIPVITKDSRKTARVQQQRKVVSKPDANQVDMAVPESTRKSMTSTRSITAGSGNQAGKPKASLRRQTAAPSPPKSIVKQTATPMTRSRVASAGLAMDYGSSSKQASRKTRAAVKRVSSIHKAPFQPTKSTKPPTRPSFELPGDAVARKLKEQREERLKRDEEAPKKSAFKARPVRLSQAPIVKHTATSKARMSLAKSDATKSSISDDRAPKNRPLTRPGSTPVAETNKRLSTAPNPKKLVRTSAVMTTRVVSHSGSGQATASSKVGLADDNRSNVTAFEAAQQKIRGKEVFNRIRIEQDERERAKKVKEEAARKARADAAERGRVASREWAEKQKLKKMGSEKNGDSKSGLASI